jgi:AcrR family transcriptional regulator
VSRRSAILDSAQSIVVREGTGALTLDKIASEAKVSKGGLLYHFSTKEQLVAALVARTIEYFDRDLAHYHKSFEEHPGTHTRAFATATMEGQWAQDAGIAPRGLDLFATVSAAFSTSPELMEPLRNAYERWQNQVEDDGIDPVLATILRLAADGLWFTEMLGLSNFTPEQRQAILGKITHLATPASEETAEIKNSRQQ